MCIFQRTKVLKQYSPVSQQTNTGKQKGIVIQTNRAHWLFDVDDIFLASPVIKSWSFCLCLQDFVEPIYFYVGAVFGLQAIYVTALFVCSWVMSGTWVAGMLAVAWYVINRWEEFCRPVPHTLITLISSCYFLLSKSISAVKLTFLLWTLSCILLYNTLLFQIPGSLVFFLFSGDLITLQLFCGSFLPQTRYNQSGPCYSSAGQLGSSLLLLPGCSFDWIPE